MTTNLNSSVAVNVIETKPVSRDESETKTSSVSEWCSKYSRAILCEVTCTMLLLFLGCMTCVPIKDFPIHPPMYSAFGFGLIVLFNIQAFGHISGAHMNPCVSVASVIFGNLPVSVGIAYILAQCAGAILGYGILVTVSPYDLAPDGVCVTALHSNHTVFQGLGVEIILTAALNFLNSAVWDPANKDSQECNSLKFGFSIAGLSLAGGSLTGASMNPARSLAPALWTGKWEHHWVYWVGPFIGGTLSALIYKYIWLKKEVSDNESRASNYETKRLHM